MKVVHLNRFNTVIGGKERYISEVKTLLDRRGVQSIDFCLAEPQNEPSPFQRFFPPRLETNAPSLIRRARAALYRVHNLQSAQAIRRLLDHEPCDVAHVHSHHHFSASTINALVARNVPIVWTLHDYHAICPVGTLFTEDAVCDRCRNRRFHHAALHRCAQTGLAGSLLSMADSAWLNWSGALGRVSRFIAPSDFTALKVVEFGLPADRVETLRYFAPVDKWSPVDTPSSGPIVFVGRLYRQKGVHVLLAALGRLKLPAGQRVVIAGDGPEMAALRQQAGRLGLDQVEFVGALGDADLRQLMTSSRMVVVPSIWYEVRGMVILEAYAIGRPVVGSNIGGIPEVIVQGETGLLCRAGDVDDLAAQIDWMLSHPAESAEMGNAARQRAETHFAPDDHLKRLTEIYAAAMQQR